MGYVKITTPLIIQTNNKTLQPALNRIKRILRKSVPEPLRPLNLEKNPSTAFLSPNVSCLYFNPNLCKAYVQNPLSTTISGLFSQYFNTSLRKRKRGKNFFLQKPVVMHSFESTSTAAHTKICPFSSFVYLSLLTFFPASRL